MYANVNWKGGMEFTGAAQSGYRVDLSSSAAVGGSEQGFRPKELLGVSLAGCTAMDVISILKKKRQNVSGFEVRIHPIDSDSHPHVWTHVHIEYLISGEDIDPAAVERAIELSTTKYCPVQAMLKPSVEIETSYKIEQAHITAV
ncbi:MAG: OsmC family protein [Anaerolineae bacterium]|nr:OsmC family protein [Anaerolineae bacterium]